MAEAAGEKLTLAGEAQTQPSRTPALSSGSLLSAHPQVLFCLARPSCFLTGMFEQEAWVSGGPQRWRGLPEAARGSWNKTDLYPLIPPAPQEPLSVRGDVLLRGGSSHKPCHSAELATLMRCVT